MKMLRATLRSIRDSILVGLVLIIPIVTTVFVFNAIINLTTNWLLKSTWLEPYRQGWTGFQLRILTLLSTIVVLYFIGLLARNVVGRRMYRSADRIIGRIPFIKSIYTTVRQISASLFTQHKTLFKEVVLVEYPRKGLFSMAFVTATVPESISAKTGGQSDASCCVSLFIPTTPNPTSGLLILAKRSELITLNMQVSDALTFIMSGGAVAPGKECDTSPTLLDKLESWIRLKNRTQEEADDVPAGES
jgi:uncharacterized membrane protein